MGYAKFEGADNTPLRPDSPALASQFAPLSKSIAADLGSTLVAWDTFNRADATGLGTSDSGHSWVPALGTSVLTIDDGGARNNSALSVAGEVIDAGIGNAVVSYWADSSGEAFSNNAISLVLRWQDANNMLRVDVNSGNVIIGKTVAGSYTALATTTVTRPAVPLHLTAVIHGAVIEATVRTLGGHQVSRTEHTLTGGDETAFPSTLTHFGLLLVKSAPEPIAHDFTVRRLTPNPS